MLTAQIKRMLMARLMSHAGPASDNPWASFDDGPEAGSGASSTLQQPVAQPGTGATAWQGWNGSQPATSAALPGHLEAAAASAMAVPSPQASTPAKAEPDMPEGMSARHNALPFRELTQWLACHNSRTQEGARLQQPLCCAPA